MKDGLSYRGCCSGSDYSLECCIKVRQTRQSTDRIMFLLSVQRKDGNTPGLKNRRKRLFHFFHSKSRLVV